MKPFDLEAAKRGEPFCYDGQPGIKTLFIGFRANGSVVYEELSADFGRGEITWAPAEALRMLPRKVVRWANVYRHTRQSREWVGGLHKSEAEAQASRARTLCNREWLGVTRVEWEE